MARVNVFAFDIETIPDTDGGRRLYDVADLEDADVVQVMHHIRRQKTGNEFLPHHLQRVVAISAVLRTADRFTVWSLGTPTSTEPELIERFFDGVEKYSPTLVTWNGSGFDLPVLHYRALVHGIQAARYWEVGDNDRDFRFNNYLNRFHYRHLDLMDVLAGYQGRAVAPLSDLARLAGFPGKLGMDGSQVWDHYRAGDVEGIRNYCETDALNTFLLYLRFERMRGHLNPGEYAAECARIREFLRGQQKAHWDQFLDAWVESA